MRLSRNYRTWALAALLTALVLVLLPGCSPTKQVSDSLGVVGNEAVEIQEDMVAATAAFEAGEDPRPLHESAAARAGRIRAEVTKANKALTGVDDKVPWWGRWLTWGAILGVLLVVTFLLWRTGALALVGAAIMALRVRWTPAVALQGEALAKLNAGQLSVREYTAAERAASPANNAAYDAAKAKLQPPKA